MSVSGEVLKRHADTIGLIRDMAIELLALREANRWIPVGERLPDQNPRNPANSVVVLSYAPNAVYKVEAAVCWHAREFSQRYFDRKDGHGSAVTHWRALPAPPEET